MGIEPIANSLSPVESVGLTLLEDRIWARKQGCAQLAPKLGDGWRPRTIGGAAQDCHDEFAAQVRPSTADENARK